MGFFGDDDDDEGKGKGTDEEKDKINWKGIIGLIIGVVIISVVVWLVFRYINNVCDLENVDNCTSQELDDLFDEECDARSSACNAACLALPTQEACLQSYCLGINEIESICNKCDILNWQPCDDNEQDLCEAVSEKCVGIEVGDDDYEDCLDTCLEIKRLGGESAVCLCETCRQEFPQFQCQEECGFGDYKLQFCTPTQLECIINASCDSESNQDYDDCFQQSQL